MAASERLIVIEGEFVGSGADDKTEAEFDLPGPERAMAVAEVRFLIIVLL